MLSFKYYNRTVPIRVYSYKYLFYYELFLFLHVYKTQSFVGENVLLVDIDETGLIICAILWYACPVEIRCKGTNSRAPISIKAT